MRSRRSQLRTQARSHYSSQKHVHPLNSHRNSHRNHLVTLSTPILLLLLHQPPSLQVHQHQRARPGTLSKQVKAVFAMFKLEMPLRLNLNLPRRRTRVRLTSRSFLCKRNLLRGNNNHKRQCRKARAEYCSFTLVLPVVRSNSGWSIRAV